MSARGKQRALCKVVSNAKRTKAGQESQSYIVDEGNF